MGEAKRRGTRDERVAEAVAKREARDRALNEAQAEHRRQRQEELERLEAAAPKVAPSERKRRVLGSYGRGGIGLVMAAALAASMSVEK
jgi:uncharacterized membrane protein YdbT with pleckstrin-like domain